MLCRQCSTINPDRCSNCLECQAPLSQSSIALLPSTSTKKARRLIEQSVIKTDIVTDTITLTEPQYFTVRRKLLGFTFANIPTMIISMFLVLELLVFTYDLMPLEILLALKITSAVIYLSVLYLLYPIVNCYWMAEQYFRDYENGFVVQVSFEPRRFRDWQGYIEDADDFGVIKFSNDRLTFQGDAGRFVLNKDDIATIKFTKKGRRGGWPLGPMALIELTYPLAGIKSIYIHARMGTNTFQARRFNQAFNQAVENTFSDRVVK